MVALLPANTDRPSYARTPLLLPVVEGASTQRKKQGAHAPRSPIRWSLLACCLCVTLGCQALELQHDPGQKLLKLSLIHI